MDPTLNVIEPTPYYDYEDDMMEEGRVVTRKDVLGRYGGKYGDENDVRVVDDDDIFVNEDGFLEDDEGKGESRRSLANFQAGFGGNYGLNRVGD